MVDSLAYHALHWFKYALQHCVWEEGVGGVGKQVSGSPDVSAVGDTSIYVMSFLSLQTNAEILHSNNSFEKSPIYSYIHNLIPHVTLHIIHS